jgi:hypothetical protein
VIECRKTKDNVRVPKSGCREIVVYEPLNASLLGGPRQFGNNILKHIDREGIADSAGSLQERLVVGGQDIYPAYDSPLHAGRERKAFDRSVLVIERTDSARHLNPAGVAERQNKLPGKKWITVCGIIDEADKGWRNLGCSEPLLDHQRNLVTRQSFETNLKRWSQILRKILVCDFRHLCSLADDQQKFREASGDRCKQIHGRAVKPMEILEHQYPKVRFAKQGNHQLFDRRGAGRTDYLSGKVGLGESERNDFIEQGQPAQKRKLTGQ